MIIEIKKAAGGFRLTLLKENRAEERKFFTDGTKLLEYVIKQRHYDRIHHTRWL